MRVIFCPYLSELKECPCEYEKNCIKKVREVMVKCEVCGINEATAKITFGAWEGKKVCGICKNNYEILQG